MTQPTVEAIRAHVEGQKWECSLGPRLRGVVLCEKCKGGGSLHPFLWPAHAPDCEIGMLAWLLERRFVPGEWRCPSCGFVLHKRVIRVADMSVSVNDRDEAELCPNDGATMKRVTWEQNSKDADAAGLALAKELRKAELERDSAQGVVESIALITAYDEPLPGALAGRVKTIIDDMLDARNRLAAAEAERDRLRAAYDEFPW